MSLSTKPHNFFGQIKITAVHTESLVQDTDARKVNWGCVYSA